MKQWIRLSALVLLLTMFLASLVGCVPEDGAGDQTPDGSDDSLSDNVGENDQENDGENDGESDKEEDKEDEPVLLNPEIAHILADSKKTQYVIVRDDAANAAVKEMVKTFRNAFWIKTGADIQIMSDTSNPIAKEIIISSMDGREEPAAEFAKITAPEQKGYRIGIVGEKIVVAAEEEFLKEALDLLVTAISDCGNGVWGIPKQYSGRMDIPKLPLKGSLYHVGEGNYSYCIPKATDTLMKTLLGDLSRDKFKLYDEHQVGKSQFKTYVKDSIEGSMVLYVMYHPEIKELRMTYGPMEYLPNVTPIAADTKATPTITQMYLQMVNNGYAFGANGVITANNGAPGMSYLLQLSDGRFIVIDGGNSDGNIHTARYDETTNKWIASDQPIQTNDVQRLYNTMKEMKSDGHGRIQIAAWFMTHPHGDHMNLARTFLERYRSEINLEIVGFNFPNEANMQGTLAAARGFRTMAEKAGATFWNMHTGQVLELAGCKIEVMSTVEDFYCSGQVNPKEQNMDLNNACTVFRVTMGNTSFMVLGDNYPTTGEFMANAYGKALQSDIMQLAHHGFNGGVYELYVAVDPKICFWPCDQYRFMTDSRNLGTSGGSYKFNYYLRNENWKRDDGTSGKRDHYTASFMTTVDATTGKVISSK